MQRVDYTIDYMTDDLNAEEEEEEGSLSCHETHVQRVDYRIDYMTDDLNAEEEEGWSCHETRVQRGAMSMHTFPQTKTFSRKFFPSF